MHEAADREGALSVARFEARVMSLISCSLEPQSLPAKAIILSAFCVEGKLCLSSQYVIAVCTSDQMPQDMPGIRAVALPAGAEGQEAFSGCHHFQRP